MSQIIFKYFENGLKQFARLVAYLAPFSLFHSLRQLNNPRKAFKRRKPEGRWAQNIIAQLIYSK